MSLYSEDKPRTFALYVASWRAWDEMEEEEVDTEEGSEVGFWAVGGREGGVGRETREGSEWLEEGGIEGGWNLRTWECTEERGGWWELKEKVVAGKWCWSKEEGVENDKEEGGRGLNCGPRGEGDAEETMREEEIGGREGGIAHETREEGRGEGKEVKEGREKAGIVAGGREGGGTEGGGIEEEMEERSEEGNEEGSEEEADK